MTWIEPEDVAEVYDIDVRVGLCRHAQGLAESVIGTWDEPVSDRLKAVMVEIVTRFWQKDQTSTTNPKGYQRERTDDYEYEQFPSSGGLGLSLTDKEKEMLLAAVGRSPLGSIGTKRDPVEMAEPADKAVDVSDPDLGAF